MSSEPRAEPRIRDGMRAALPLAPSPILFGLSYGVLADATGFGAAAAVVMSATTFAGAAQFASLSVLDAGGTIAAAVLAADLPERALRRDQRDGRVDLPGQQAAAARGVAVDRRRVLGALGAARSLRVADPRRVGARLLRPLGREHCRRYRGGRDPRGSERARARRGVRRAVPRARSAVPPRDARTPGCRAGRGDHSRAHSPSLPPACRSSRRPLPACLAYGVRRPRTPHPDLPGGDDRVDRGRDRRRRRRSRSRPQDRCSSDAEPSRHGSSRWWSSSRL